MTPQSFNYFGSFLLLLIVAVSVSAQSLIENGAITGSVADQSGAAISGATVRVRQINYGFERATTTDASGNYRIEQLRPGDYLISAASEGFSLVSHAISLESRGLTVNFTLRPGSLAENISVISTEIAATPEELRRIPGSIDSLNRQTLEIARVFNFNEALRKFSGVYVRDEEGLGLRPSISIRGLDPNRSAKVLLLEDGVPLANAPYGDTDAYYHPPVERYSGIEILKGSGQIAYGPNTLSGLLNYLTPNPPSNLSGGNAFNGSVTLTGGNRNYFNGFASLGASFGRTGIVFDALRKQGEGGRENMRSGLNDYLLKVVTDLDEDRRQTLSFKATYYGEDSNITYSGLTQAEYDANPRQNPFRNDYFYGDRWGGSAIYTNAINSRAVLTTTFYAQNFKRDWWRQSSNSDQRPNRRGRPGCTGMADLSATCGNEGRLRSYDVWGVDPRLKLSSRLGETDLGFRAHWETQNRIQQNNDTLGPNGRGGVTSEDNQRKNQAFSGFVQHRFLLGRWTITPGLRVEHVDIERTNRLVTPFVTGETDLTQLIPGFGFSYSPTENVTFYAGVHRGFAPPRPADIINGSGGVVELDPELSWNYEAGVRSLPVKGLRVDATFFRLDYQNQIVPANLSGGVGATLTSAGETLHQGLEFTGRLDAGTIFDSPHNFYFRAAYTWIPTAEYQGVRYSNVAGFSNVSVSGNRLIYSPEQLLNLNFGYSHPSGFDALVEAVYIGEQFGDDLNTTAPTANGQRGLIPAYTTWNATVSYRIGGLDRFAPTIFVTTKNLMNDTFIVDRRRGVMPGIPRLVQGGVKFRF
jgi:Fe(3+) dicitrate transport protein